MRHGTTVGNVPGQTSYLGPPHSDAEGDAVEPHRDRQLVLVVEDDVHDWEIYGKLLWYNGFDVICTANGRDGLRLAREHHPDLVLLDMRLPGLDGLEVCRRLKADADLAGIPVIMLTGRSRQKYGKPAMEAGCHEFLEKPQSPLELLHHIESLIGRPPDGGNGEPPELQGLH